MWQTTGDCSMHGQRRPGKRAHDRASTSRWNKRVEYVTFAVMYSQPLISNNNNKNACRPHGRQPAYLSRHTTDAPLSRSSTLSLLQMPFSRTSFGKRAFSCAAPSTRNSLPASVLDSDCLQGCISIWLKKLVCLSLPTAADCVWLPPARLKLRQCGRYIQVSVIQ